VSLQAVPSGLVPEAFRLGPFVAVTLAQLLASALAKVEALELAEA
jgi:hypothetical protein